MTTTTDRTRPTIAVTGATGQLGRLIVADLLERVPAESVIAVVRDPAKGADLGFELRQATYDDRPSLEAAFDGVDTVVFVSGSEAGQRVPQHRNVVDAAVTAGVRHLIYTSAPHADATTLILAPEHRATEEMVIDSGLTWTLLRNNWYHENYALQLPAVRATGELVGAAGDGRVASAARADYAAGAAVVATTDGHQNRIYELSGDVAWGYADLAQAYAAVLGTPVTYRPVSPAEFDAELAAAGVDEANRAFIVGLDVNTAEGTLADATDRLRTLLGRPTTPLIDTLRTLV